MFKRKIIKSDTCQNCQQELDGENFCPECGQLNNIRKPVVSELFFELISNMFAFDSKFYRSVGPLLFSPAKLTIAFGEGKRQKYMMPLRLFLVTAIVLLTLNTVNYKSRVETSDNKINTTLDLNDSLSLGDNSNFFLDFGEDQLNDMAELIYAQDTLTDTEGLKTLQLENTFFNRFKYHQITKLKKLEFNSFWDYIKSKLLIIFLLFIPFLALLLKLLHFNQPQYYYIDHYIFSLHQQTTLFILLILNSLVNMIWNTGWSTLLTFFIFAIHLFIAMKRFYKESTGLTILKYVLVNMGFFILAIFFVVLSSIVTFLLY